MKVYVNYDDKRWRKYKIDFDKIANAAGRAAGARAGAEVSIILTDDANIHSLNRQYRNIDRATNVLSFELGDDMLLGDVYISLDTVRREAAAAGISVAEHTAHMVVHGVLHLMGYDHIDNADAIVMEAKEIKVLKQLGIKNPYEEDAPSCADGSCCPGARTIAWLKKIRIPRGGAWRYVAYAAAGAAAALGFAPFNLWWMGLAGIGAAYWLSVQGGPRRGIFRDFLQVMPFGAAYGVAMLWWMLNSIYVVPELTAQFAVWTVPAVAGIALGGGIIFSLPFVAVRRVRASDASRPFVFAGTWTLVLWLREWALTGFPWNPVANMTLGAPAVANSMSLWGALGLTFVVVGFVASLVGVIRRRRSVRVWISFLIFVALGVVGAMAGYRNIVRAELSSGAGRAMIRIVQPARSQSEKISYSAADARARAEENVRQMMRLASAPGAPDLIVFPETTYPFVIVDDNMPMSKILATDVVMGATSYAGGNLYNSMIVANPDGRIDQIYSKSHLVPFGEYSPMGIMPSPSNLSRGDGPALISLDLDGDEFVFAPAICYEIIFSDTLVPRAQISPDAIINITNDTWFGETPGVFQHLDMVRRYAIESGLPVIRANYSGISAFVLSDGEVMAALPVGQSGVLDGTVWGAHMTAYRAIGRDGVMIIILLFACVCAVALGRDEKNV